VSVLDRPGQRPADRFQDVVGDYERDLNDLLKSSERIKTGTTHGGTAHTSRLVRCSDFEDRAEGNPELQRNTEELQSSSQQILEQTSVLESVNWGRVKRDHA
jgi:hypothetical protein